MHQNGMEHFRVLLTPNNFNKEILFYALFSLYMSSINRKIAKTGFSSKWDFKELNCAALQKKRLNDCALQDIASYYGLSWVDFFGFFSSENITILAK